MDLLTVVPAPGPCAVAAYRVYVNFSGWRCLLPFVRDCRHGRRRGRRRSSDTRPAPATNRQPAAARGLIHPPCRNSCEFLSLKVGFLSELSVTAEGHVMNEGRWGISPLRPDRRVSAAIVGTAAVTPLQTPRPMPATVAATVELASITSGLDGPGEQPQGGRRRDRRHLHQQNAFVDGVESTVNHVLSIPGNIQASIKTTYDTAERWPAYAAAWAQFSLGLVPGLWWVAPASRWPTTPQNRWCRPACTPSPMSSAWTRFSSYAASARASRPRRKRRHLPQGLGRQPGRGADVAALPGRSQAPQRMPSRPRPPRRRQRGRVRRHRRPRAVSRTRSEHLQRPGTVGGLGRQNSSSGAQASSPGCGGWPPA